MTKTEIQQYKLSIIPWVTSVVQSDSSFCDIVCYLRSIALSPDINNSERGQRFNAIFELLDLASSLTQSEN